MPLGEEFEQWAAGIHKKYRERQEQYFKHIESREDIDLIILKGHLIIEERITDALENTLKEKYYAQVKQQSFSFANKVLVLHESYNFDSSMEPLFDSLDMLNKLRNDLAHNLEVSQIENRAHGICKPLYDGGILDTELKGEEVIDQLKKSIILISELVSLPDMKFPKKQ